MSAPQSSPPPPPVEPIPPATPTALPQSAWGLALTSLVGQLFSVVDGGRGDNTLIPSVLLGAALVGWVSAGVLRARTIRVAITWIVLVVVLIANLVGGEPGDLVHLGMTIAQLVFFVQFTRSPYYRWQKTRPREPGPSLAPLIAIALVVGALGGWAGTDDRDVRVEMQF